MPAQRYLTGGKQMFQSFNNCGPASLTMALSYYGINETQENIGRQLRPIQNSQGDNDDKSVTLEELEKKAQEYGFLTYHRPGGDVDMIKKFINMNIPVIVRTWLATNDDIGHFRLVKGYNEKELLQDDSYQGKDKFYSYSEFNEIWKKFNYEYLVLVPKEKQKEAEEALGENLDEKTAWRNAQKSAEEMLRANPNDKPARFNLLVALYHNGEYSKAITEYEKIESQLEMRTLWYQLEPVLAYYKVGNYDRVLSITNGVLNNHNRSYAEFYFIRGMIYQKQGKQSQADEEFAKAQQYKGKYSEVNIESIK